MATRQDIVLRQRGIDLLNSWRMDWNKFIREALGVTLDKEQQAIVTSVQHNPRTTVASGTARGKDFVAACCAVCFMFLTPRWNSKRELIENTKVALTAPTDRQVKNIMMPEVSRLCDRAKQRGIVLPGRVKTDRISTDNAEWFLTGFKADEKNHEAWSGFHAVHTMFIITEASGVSDNIFDAIEGNLQGDSRILLVFNPNTPIGYAARSQRGDRWVKFRLNSLTAPNVKERRILIPGQVDYEWIIDKLKQWCIPIREDERQEELDDFEFEGQWYRPEDLFRKKVLGKFPKVADDVLIPMQWIEVAQERWIQTQGREPIERDSTPRMLGVDVAGMGRDATCYVERMGAWCSGFDCHNSGGTADHMAVAGKIATWRRRNPYGFVSIDTIGEGAGVYSRCREVEDSPEYIISCKYSEWGGNNPEKMQDVTGQYRFVNMRAYLFWCVRDWLNPKNNTGAMLPPDARFAEEATEIRWFFRSDGKIQIEPKEDIKKRLGRSTDLFDALANTFYPLNHRRTIDIERLQRIF
nr:MAG TPA: large terminase [Caudoviricetes sp.]